MLAKGLQGPASEVYGITSNRDLHPAVKTNKDNSYRFYVLGSLLDITLIAVFISSEHRVIFLYCAKKITEYESPEQIASNHYLLCLFESLLQNVTTC